MPWSQLERQARRLTLPRTPKTVLKCLVHFAKPDGTSIFPGVRTIMDETDFSERTVQNALRYLELEGWIIPVHTKGGRGRFGHYRLELNQFEVMVQCKPAPPEPKPLEQQERFIVGLLKKSPARLSEARRAHWQAELARVQGQLAGEPPGEPDFWEEEAKPNLFPVPVTPVPLVPVTPPAAIVTPEQRKEANQLRESIAFRQARVASSQPGSKAYQRWQRLLSQAQEELARLFGPGPSPPPAAVVIQMQGQLSPIQIQEV